MNVTLCRESQMVEATGRYDLRPLATGETHSPGRVERPDGVIAVLGDGGDVVAQMQSGALWMSYRREWVWYTLADGRLATVGPTMAEWSRRRLGEDWRAVVQSAVDALSA